MNVGDTWGGDGWEWWARRLWSRPCRPAQRRVRRHGRRGCPSRTDRWARHQCPANHYHLLLPTGDIAGLGMAALCQAREIRVGHLQVPLHRGTPIFPGIRPRQQILFAGQMAEAVASFHDLNDATTHQQRWVETVHALTTIFNAALGDLATLGTQ